MPIRGLTDNPRMPRIGKIRLGIKVKNAEGKEYPRALDHFVCPEDVVDALREKGVPFCDGSCKAEPGPTMVPIMFVTDDVDTALSASFRAYTLSNGLICKGDGYTADALLDAGALKDTSGVISAPLPVTAWANRNSKATVRAQVECWGEGYDGKPPCPLFAKKGCKKMMMPQFAIVDAPGIGVYQLDTGSSIGLQNAFGFLTYLSTITGGRISGIPLEMRVEPMDVTPEGKKKTIHVVKLEAGFSLSELTTRLKQPPMAAFLPPPDESEGADLMPEDASLEQLVDAEAEAPAAAIEPDEITPLAAANGQGDPFVAPGGEIDMGLFMATLSEKRLTVGNLTVVVGGGPKKATAPEIAAWLRAYLDADASRSLTALIAEADKHPVLAERDLDNGKEPE